MPARPGQCTDFTQSCTGTIHLFILHAATRSAAAAKAATLLVGYAGKPAKKVDFFFSKTDSDFKNLQETASATDPFVIL